MASTGPTNLLPIASFLLLLLHGSTVMAADLFFDWTVAYSQLSPLGVSKQVITINGQFPGPLVNTTTNDVVYVNLINQLDEPFLLTWNGVQMRRNSWNDGVRGTNCPVPVGKNWTYQFQVKDQIGSFSYFPSLMFHRAAGGYGPLRVNNRVVIAVPFDQPRDDFDVLVGDWYNAGHKELRSTLEGGGALAASPDGLLINGLGPMGASFTFKPGSTYRLRISNVGIKASINFRIQGHLMQLVETEGSYVIQDKYKDLDIHVGQSYSVLVTADQTAAAYFIVASTRFLDRTVTGTAVLRYAGVPQQQVPQGSPPPGPSDLDYAYSLNQARSMRWHLSVGAARPNPQGSFHYGLIPISRTIVLENNKVDIGGKPRYTINGISFTYPDTPLKLADYFAISGTFISGRTAPSGDTALGTPVIDAQYRDFIQIVFQNALSEIQSWHVDGYNFFVVGMESGQWDESKRANYNLVDAVSRSTVQVYPNSWTAILLSLDNYGMWNIRSQQEENRYLGQELYMRVKGSDPVPNVRDEMPIPANALKCGRAA